MFVTDGTVECQMQMTKCSICCIV